MKTFMKPVSILTPLVLLALALTAPAALTYASLGIAGETNAFITGNVNTNGGQGGGSFIVGGNWTGSNYTVRNTAGTPTPASLLPAGTALYIGGSNSVSNYVRTNSGNMVIAGAKGKISQNGGGKYSKASYDLAPTVANLTKLSGDLFKLGGVSLNTAAQNNIVVNLGLNTVSAGNLKVYTVDGSRLSGNKTLTFSGGTGNETVVVNVTGATMDWGLTMSGGLDSSRILWNFSGSTVNVNQRGFNGTLLANNATINQSQSITGSIIAKNLNVNNSATLNAKTFTGKIPLVSAPEPAGMLTMGGFLGLALLSRRRQPVRL